MNLNRKSLLFLFFLTLTFTIETNAMHSSGSDSCGLGWAVTKKKSLSATTTRATTNSWLPPTFGMTSGTIGCDRHSIAQKDIETIRYITTYFDLLKYEMALGSGELLTGLAQLMKHSDKRCFAEVLHTHYGEIVSNRTPAEAFQAIQKATSGACHPTVI